MTVSLATKLTVVSMAARGRTTASIADRTGLPAATAHAIAREHGAPDLGKLAAAAEWLRKQVDKEAGTTDETATVDQLGKLAAEAERIGSAKLARRAQWIAEKLDELRVDVAAMVKRYEAEEDTRAMRARLAELRAEEAELRAKLNPAKPDPAAVKAAKAENTMIRVWAAAAGIHCHPYGIIPSAVRVAYEQREAS